MTLLPNQEDAFRALAEALSASSTPDFFEHLASRLAQLLAADHVLIAEVLGRESAAQTLAVFSQGALQASTRYCLHGTPCAEAVRGESCVYPNDVCDQFPDDTLLAEMGVEAYLGVPFHAPDNQPLGFIAVMHNEPWQPLPHVMELLRIAAVQIGAELARRRAETAVHESERRLETLMKHLPGMAYQCRNDDNWTMQFVSPGCEQLTGYRSQALVGNREVSFLELIHEDDRAATFEEAERAIAEQRGFCLQYRLRRKDGQIRRVMETGQAVFDAAGDVLRFEGFVMDVTEQAIAERVQKAVVQVATAVTARAGGDFFRKLVDHLCQSLGADAALVAVLEGGGEDARLRAVSAVRSGTAVEVDDEVLGQSGFAQLTGKQEWVVVDKADLPLPCGAGQSPLPARAFVARRLENTNGAVLGVVLVQFSQPLTDPDLPTQVLRILSAVAGNELERQRSDRRIQQLSYIDSVTGLPNRSHFLETLSERIEQARQIDQPLLLVMLDLKRFKDINDTLGHRSGDRLLHAVGRRLQEAIRDSDYLARLSGDEFVLLLPDVAHVNVDLMLQRFQVAFETPVSIGTQRVALAFSSGAAHFPRDADNPGDLMQRASIALHHAKLIDSPSCAFDAGMIESLHRRKQMLDSFVVALREDRLQLHYQPQFDLESGALSGAEALCRWQDAEFGWVSPGEFIPMAEERGLMRELGDWVIARARRQLQQWQQQGCNLPGRLSVNIAAQQFEQEDLTEHFLRLTDGIDARHFALELTESGLVRDPERAVNLMKELRAAGFSIAIDDFGTGYSSLSYLRRFSAETLKIDMSFVRDMLTNASDRAIVSTIVAMARTLNMNTIAEGVEEEQQGCLLRELGCTQAQGFYYGRPSDPESFAAQWMAC